MAFLSLDPDQSFDTLLTAAFSLAVGPPFSQAGLHGEEFLPCGFDKLVPRRALLVRMWLAGICSRNNGIVLRFQTYCGANCEALFPCGEASRLSLTGCMNAEYRASSLVVHIVDSFSYHLLLFRKRASAHGFLAPPYHPHLHCRLPLSRHHHSLCPSQSRTATTELPRRQIHCQSAKLQQLLLGLTHRPKHKGWYTWQGQLTYLDDAF